MIEKCVGNRRTVPFARIEAAKLGRVFDVYIAIAQYWWTPEDYLRILLGGRDEQGINSDKEA
jgi:hypothetical protein